MHRTLIIAEAGVNHNGNLECAKKLVAAAAEAGADIVKFQTFQAEMVASQFAQKAGYQEQTTGVGNQLEMLRKLQLDIESHREIVQCCSRHHIEFLSTPFDLQSIDLLVQLGVPTIKIPSGEITNLPYLRKIGSLGKKIIMSTGMALVNEIKDALDVLERAGTSRANITILHCNTEYPTPYSDVNLLAMRTLCETFGLPVGYSDHTMGIEVPIAAVAMGAVVIEKHLTLDRSMDGPDHRASIEPTMFADMVRCIRNVEESLGSGGKKPSPSESRNMMIARKSIVAMCPIRKGDMLTPENITTKRPGSGISPMDWDRVVGTKAVRAYAPDEMITL